MYLTYDWRYLIGDSSATCQKSSQTDRDRKEVNFQSILRAVKQNLGGALEFLVTQIQHLKTISS